MLASNILDLTHLNSSKNYRQERSVDTYRASCGTLNAKWTNNSFFSLEKKRCVNHQVGPDSHFHQGRLSEDTETLLLFSSLVVVFAVAGIKNTFQTASPKRQVLTVWLS